MTGMAAEADKPQNPFDGFRPVKTAEGCRIWRLGPHPTRPPAGRVSASMVAPLARARSSCDGPTRKNAIRAKCATERRMAEARSRSTPAIATRANGRTAIRMVREPWLSPMVTATRATVPRWQSDRPRDHRVGQGDRYEGEWLSNQRSGRGAIKMANGNTYDGEWRDDKSNGIGIFTLKNGDHYTGDWRDGKASARVSSFGRTVTNTTDAG